MAKITNLLLIFLLLPLSLWSQEDISIGKKFSIFSDILQEDRSYWIYLPENYEENILVSYPVIYLLDGDMFFHSMVGMVKTLSSGRGLYKDEYIIVGVLNVDRTRDLTPSATTVGRDGDVGFFAEPQGGGSDLFCHFLTKELRQEIDLKYRTNKENILIGHSYAGLFTVNTFLHHTNVFNAYIAIDPSLWWDRGKLVDEAESLVEEKNFENIKLYIAVASKKRIDRVDIHLDRANFFLQEVLPQTKNLYFKYKSFPEETHGTIAIPGIYDGFKQLMKR